MTLDNVGVGEDRFRLFGAHNFPEELALVRAGVAEELFARFTLRGAGGSDGWSFQIQGIPALFAHADAPQPYVHTPEDDAGTISPEMLRVVGLFSDQALRAAADTSRPVPTTPPAVWRAICGGTASSPASSNPVTSR